MMRNTSCDSWADRLSAYLDHDMRAGERRRLDAHLAACPNCRAVLNELEGVVHEARRLVPGADPARDLWPGIAERLSPRPAPWWRRALGTAPATPVRGFAYAVAVLVLAAVVGGGFLWLRAPSDLAGPTPAVATRADGGSVPSIGAEEAYDDSVATLRQAVQAKLVADPQVIHVLDRNLDALSVAIADYEDALARDPADARLRQRLEDARRRKIEMLRYAAGLAAGAGD